MSILIDTHAAWFYAANNTRLPNHVIDQLDTTDADDLFVLDVTFYEWARLLKVGKIYAENPYGTLKHLERLYQTLASNAEVAWRAATFDWTKRNGKVPHLDPADRAIMAAAAVGKMTLVTADREMQAFAQTVGVQVLW